MTVQHAQTDGGARFGLDEHGDEIDVGGLEEGLLDERGV
jgi:hypothetical protein